MIKNLIMRKILIFLIPPFFIITTIFGLLFFVIISSGGQSSSASSVEFNGVYSEDLPIFKEIKGRGQITDEIAQYAVGSAIKYHLLPSVILSQYAYESEWGKSQSAKEDNNFFGITWFEGCPFPKGTSRGIGGSEGGNYMKFPNSKSAFSYYGFMVVSQSNFKACMGNKSPSECLLILGRGGYAAAGIDENSAYFKGAMSIIESNKLTEYDDFAISKWASFTSNDSNSSSSNSDTSFLNDVLGQRINGGQCYGLTAYYVSKLGGPQLMNSGFEFAQNIGTDYDWQKYGWNVIVNPKPTDLRAGDVINWKAGGVLSPGIYGHTGIISSVSNNGNNFSTYEQQGDGVQIVKQFNRTYDITPIQSIVRKVK